MILRNNSVVEILYDVKPLAMTKVVTVRDVFNSFPYTTPAWLGTTVNAQEVEI